MTRRDWWTPEHEQAALDGIAEARERILNPAKPIRTWSEIVADDAAWRPEAVPSARVKPSTLGDAMVANGSRWAEYGTPAERDDLLRELTELRQRDQEQSGGAQ